MKKYHQFFCLIVCVLLMPFLVACGKGFPFGSLGSFHIRYEEDHQSSCDAGHPTIPSMVKIKSLKSKMESYFETYRSNVSFQDFNRSLFGIYVMDHTHKTIADPSINSDAKLDSYYNQIVQQLMDKSFDKDSYLWIISGGTQGVVHSLSSDQVKMAVAIYNQLIWLEGMGQRLEGAFCRVSWYRAQSIFDVRKFPGFDINVWTKYFEQDQATFYAYLKTSFGDTFYARFLGMKNNQNSAKFMCQTGSNGQVEMIIPLSLDFSSVAGVNMDKIHAAISRMADRFWNNSSLRLQITFGGSGYGGNGVGNIVHIRSSGNSLSSANPDSLTINMAERELISPSFEFESILAHELGHILGFPDCYLEFFDKDKQEMVYYELDPRNLMCSTIGVIPQNYFLQVKNSRCVWK